MKTMVDVENMSPNMLVSWFMLASYAYYVVGGESQLMDDMTFDRLVQRLKEKYDEAEQIFDCIFYLSSIWNLNGSAL